jgi:hypothetical protein
MVSKMCKWRYVNIVPQVSKRCLFKAVVTRGNHIALIYGHAFPTNGLKVWSTVNQTATQSCVCVHVHVRVCLCVFTNKDILADLRRNGMCVSHKHLLWAFKVSSALQMNDVSEEAYNTQTGTPSAPLDRTQVAWCTSQSLRANTTLSSLSCLSCSLKQMCDLDWHIPTAGHFH